MSTSTELSESSASDNAASFPTPPLRARTTANPPRQKRAPRKFAKPFVFAVVAVAGLAWLGHVVWHAYHYEKTDNAYVMGHIHQVSPQVDGQVQAVLVQDNQVVKAGDVLVRLDPLEFEIALQKERAASAQAQAQQAQATAAIAQTDSQAAEARARVAQAQAQINQATAQFELARLTFDRTEKLFGDNGALTQADLDNALGARQEREAAQAAARANLVAAEAGVRSAESAQEAAHAQTAAASANAGAAATAVQDAERKLAYTNLAAPTDGRIGNRAVEAGNRVQAGQILFAVAEPAVWVVANFKETQLARMRPDMPVEMTIDALPGEILHGKIDSLAPASGAQFALLPPDNATGNFNKVVQRIPVKITFDPADLQRLGDRLRLGFSVVVDIRVR